ncbi:MAG: Crp/Fnr family transcriptional regulator [Nitrospirae bacterium]|nr:Crp/Fnr family transcriptional regulator [Nitrospirota bacterium]
MLNCQACPASKSCFFGALDPAARTDIEQHVVVNRYSRGEVIFHEGVEPHGVYILCAGRSKVYRMDEGGHQLAVRLAGTGDLLGYRSLMAGSPYSASGEVIEDATVAFLDRPFFYSVLQKHPMLVTRLIRQMARQLGEAEGLALRMAYQGSQQRVASLLANGIHGNAPTQKDGPYPFPLLRRQDLAELAGLALETTIRVLRGFEEDGLIRIKGREITVLQPAKLSDLAHAVH